MPPVFAWPPTSVAPLPPLFGIPPVGLLPMPPVEAAPPVPTTPPFPVPPALLVGAPVSEPEQALIPIVVIAQTGTQRKRAKAGKYGNVMVDLYYLAVWVPVGSIEATLV